MKAVAPIVPFSLRDAPALIERALPVQRLSAEAYKEQMAVQSKTLIALGSYWKGRKPLILNKACILGCLLPATADLAKDLSIFEMLMGMDADSLAKRLRLKPHESVPAKPYRDLIDVAKRPEELREVVHSHIWPAVNAHLGTDAESFSELVEQLGIMRFGHRPRVADTFSGSGQIPFEAARLGCEVFASDINPVACLLTWGAFNIVGGSIDDRARLVLAQKKMVEEVQAEMDRIGVEADGNGWRPKAFLYCVEARCPQTGWLVPLLSTRIVSKSKRAIVELIARDDQLGYDIRVRAAVSEADLSDAEGGTVRSDGRGKDPFLVHTVEGVEYRTKIGTLRGDHRLPDGATANRLRQWEASDFMPRPEDLYQERLYAVQWTRRKPTGNADESEFRSVTDDDLRRERVVERYVEGHLKQWQASGWLPDMRIEAGYNTDQPIRERGWTRWHHLFCPRQLMFLGLANKYACESKSPELSLLLSRLTDWSSKLCRYGTGAARESIAATFYNQALNTLFTYGVRPFDFAKWYLLEEFEEWPLPVATTVRQCAATQVSWAADIFITDPPYGDAVKYEEITEFFIAWLRKNPSVEFSEWTWDSLRALAIKGEDEDFRRGMVAAYKHMAELMPDDGIQVVMFTHQSGSIWADMANIVWAAGLSVSAAWYVVTETESALRAGSYVKGTVLLVLRKRKGALRATRDDLGWDIQDEVEKQVAMLTGLNQSAKARYRDENLFADADLQMAGYAAALQVLTQYSVIDGREMASEAIRPRVRGETTFVDELIAFAVGVANQTLVPKGIDRGHWDRLKPAERFYLKLLELESQGSKSLDNYQNFAKAFKVADFRPLMADGRANNARLKSAVELGRAEMSDGSELAHTPLRAVLYAAMELVKGVDGTDVLAHLSFNVEGFFDPAVRAVLVALADFLAGRLVELRPDEASAARVLSELIKSQTI